MQGRCRPPISSPSRSDQQLPLVLQHSHHENRQVERLAVATQLTTLHFSAFHKCLWAHFSEVQDGCFEHFSELRHEQQSMHPCQSGPADAFSIPQTPTACTRHILATPPHETKRPPHPLRKRGPLLRPYAANSLRSSLARGSRSKTRSPSSSTHATRALICAGMSVHTRSPAANASGTRPNTTSSSRYLA